VFAGKTIHRNLLVSSGISSSSGVQIPATPLQ